MKNLFFGEFGKTLTFTTKRECVAHAPQIGWKPAKLDYRKNRLEEERYFLNLYLKWVFAHFRDCVVTPLTVTRAGENMDPDFRVVEAGLEYGLEVSRATTSLFQQVTARCIKVGVPIPEEVSAGRKRLSACIELTSELSVDQHSSNPDVFLHHPGQSFYGDGWLGLSGEIIWADIVARCIAKKLGKLRLRYRRTIEKCDLVLYSDVAAVTWKLNPAVELLRERLPHRNNEGSQNFFRRVSIIHENWAIFDAFGAKLKIVTKDGWPPAD